MSNPVLDPEVLGGIAREVTSLPIDEMMPRLFARLREEYGDHIAKEPEWLFNLNGGATGVMVFLHASLSEYLVVFGTPLGTEGFSGRYAADIHDWVLAGQLWNLRLEEPLHRRVHATGDHTFLARGDATGFRLTQDAWLLEYGRGAIVKSLPHILGDAVFRGQDPATIFKTLSGYGSLAIHELFGAKDDE